MIKIYSDCTVLENYYEMTIFLLILCYVDFICYFYPVTCEEML